MPRSYPTGLQELLEQDWCESHSTLSMFVVPNVNSGTTASLIPKHYATAAIVSDGVTYEARLSKESGSALLRQSLGIATDRAEIAIEDADGAIRAEFAQWGSAIQGAAVELGRAWRNLYTGQTFHKILMRGIVGQPKYNGKTVQLSIISDAYAGGSVGGGRVVTLGCQWTFPNPDKGIVGRECGYSGPLRTCNKLYDDAGGCSGRSRQHRYGGFTHLQGKSAVDGASSLAAAPVFTSPSFTDGGIATGIAATDTAVLQAKIDALYAAGGGTLQLRGSEYKANLTLKDNVRIVGAGMGRTIISSTTNAPILGVGTTAFNAAVTDLTIKGSVSAGSSQIGLQVEGTGQYWGFEIRNLWVQDCGGKGIYYGQNPFSVVIDNIHVDNCAGYPYEFDCPIAPGMAMRDIYAHGLRSTGAVGFRFKAGRFYCENLNGIDNVPTVTGSKWTVIGKKNGVDGDSTDSGANVHFMHCNLEQWDTHGALIYGASTVSWDGNTVFDGGGNVNQVGIEYDLAGDGSTYYSQFIKRGFIADSVDFGEGAAAYKNSQPIHANGFAPLQTQGQGPMQGGSANPRCNVFRNNATSKVESLPRADGNYNARTITANTTISPGNAPEFILCDHTAALALVLPWAGWFTLAQSAIEVSDVSAAGASTYNITVTATSGTINGAGSYVIATNGGSVRFLPDGAGDWRVIAGSTLVPLTDDPGNGRVTNLRRYAAPTTAIGAPAFSFTDQYGLGMTRIADRVLGFATETTTGAGGVEAMRLDGSSGAIRAEISGTLQSGPVTVIKEWSSSSSSNLMADFQSYGDAIRYTFRHANGTAASPTQTLSGDTIFNLQARSYHSGGAFATAARAAISAEAQENHTSGAQGTRLRFITTPSGSTTQAERVRITGEGLVGIINTSPSAYLDVISNATGTPSAEFQAASGETGTASNVIFRDGSGTATVTITANGAIIPASMADSAAPNGSIYYSTTASKLVFKDGGGTVNNLY